MSGKQRKFKGIKRPPERWQKDHNAALRNLLQFDDADMKSNRNGEITESQLRRLRCIRVVSCVEMGFYLSLTLLFIWVFLNVPIEMTYIGIVGLMCMAVFTVYTLALVIREIVFLINLSLDLKTPTIIVITGSGKLAPAILGFKTVPDSYWVTHNQRFNVRRENRFRWKIWSSFHDGYCYTIFYVPHSRTLVSAEISRDEDIEALLAEK